MIIVSKEEGAKWPNLGSLTELRGFYGALLLLCIIFVMKCTLLLPLYLY